MFRFNFLIIVFAVTIISNKSFSRTELDQIQYRSLKKADDATRVINMLNSFKFEGTASRLLGFLRFLDLNAPSLDDEVFVASLDELSNILGCEIPRLFNFRQFERQFAALLEKSPEGRSTRIYDFENQRLFNDLMNGEIVLYKNLCK